MTLALFSNNPLCAIMCGQTESGQYTTGSALDILRIARDAIHKGWRLLNHPLYGNYRPYQQPFRTLLLEAPFSFSQSSSASVPAQIDVDSLQFIEEALLIFTQTRCIHPEDAPKKLYEDCAEIDFALIRHTLENAGIEIVRGELPFHQHFSTQ